jgi:hypothetical protein
MSAVQKIKIPLFTNKKKTNDKQPVYSAIFEPEEKFVLASGKKYQIAGWNQTSKNGLEYISLQITEATDLPPANKEKGLKPVTVNDAVNALGYEVAKTGHAGIDESEPF